MRSDKIIYWIATGLLSLGLASAGATYLVTHKMDHAFQHYGFPPYFQTELGIAKVIAAIILIFPGVSSKIREWAYMGVSIVFVSALIAHLSVDGATTVYQPLFAICLWAGSFFFYIKTRPERGKLKL